MLGSFDYDLLVIGLGPAGMAVSIMGAEMGLRVCAIEKHKIGGECMNVGCIPSKALLKMAEVRHLYTKFKEHELESEEGKEIKVLRPFEKIARDLKYINDSKTVKMFEKVDLILGKGAASFIDANRVQVDDKVLSAKRIFIAVGSRPSTPAIKNIHNVPYLTNETIFSLNEIPKSLLIVGAGAIGIEMAQAFSRLGSKVTILERENELLPTAEKKISDEIKKSFIKEQIEISCGVNVTEATIENGQICLHLSDGRKIDGEKLLIATGRSFNFEKLHLEHAGVEVSKKGIKVNNYLQTTAKNIYAVGDCNASFLFSHAAMHQGMIALMNSMSPWPFKQNYKKFVVPWTVFCDPEISYVGATKKELDEQNIKYEYVEVKYGDYGAAIAENYVRGVVGAYIGSTGKIFGACVIGKGSGEMINEWAMAIQNKIPIYKVMMLQHSFPSMSFLNKRVSEQWMMGKMKSNILKKIIRFIW